MKDAEIQERALIKALDKAKNESKKGLTLMELSVSTGLPKEVAYYHLKNLIERQIVDRIDEYGSLITYYRTETPYYFISAKDKETEKVTAKTYREIFENTIGFPFEGQAKKIKQFFIRFWSGKCDVCGRSGGNNFGVAKVKKPEVRHLILYCNACYAKRKQAGEAK